MRRPRAWVSCLFLSRVPHPSRSCRMGRVRVPALRPLFRFRWVLWVPHAPPSRVGLLPFTLAGAASFPLLVHGKGAGSGPPPLFPPGLFLRVPHPSPFWSMGRVRVSAQPVTFSLSGPPSFYSVIPSDAPRVDAPRDLLSPRRQFPSSLPPFPPLPFL